jgi:diacylglycerol kinase
MSKNNNLFLAFQNAFHGVRFVFTSERNAKIHLAIAVLVVAFSFILKISSTEWCFILFAIGFVWASECLNTAVEKITDLASPGYHDLAKLSKDTAAAGVLIASMTAAAIGLVVFLPKILLFINRI